METMPKALVTKPYTSPNTFMYFTILKINSINDLISVMEKRFLTVRTDFLNKLNPSF
jgi:hypothetical protein